MQNLTESEAIMRKLYLLSKPLQGVQHLIGILSEENGEYQFEYKFGGKLPAWYLSVEEFPEYNKKYAGKDVEKFIYSYIPKPNDEYINGFLKSANLDEYDKWELLKYCGQYDPVTQRSLKEELPEGVCVYE
jgi:hypothetical protein